MRYVKYHALGNDYVVIRPADLGDGWDQRRIQRICHRHYGVGSDGVLLGPLQAVCATSGFASFNPDGSEAEKSGNGLRIFAHFLGTKVWQGNSHLRLRLSAAM